MDLSMVGEVMSHRAKVNTLEKVNVSLVKTTNDQAEQQATALLESIAPAQPMPEGNKGKNVNLTV